MLGYNWCARQQNLLVRLNRFAHDLRAYFVTGARVSGHGDGKRAPLKKALTMAFRYQDPGPDEVMNRNQHDAAGGRHAGAAHHLHHHRAGDEALSDQSVRARRTPEKVIPDTVALSVAMTSTGTDRPSATPLAARLGRP